MGLFRALFTKQGRAEVRHYKSLGSSPRSSSRSSSSPSVTKRRSGHVIEGSHQAHVQLWIEQKKASGQWLPKEEYLRRKGKR